MYDDKETGEITLADLKEAFVNSDLYQAGPTVPKNFECLALMWLSMNGKSTKLVRIDHIMETLFEKPQHHGSKGGKGKKGPLG
jgi:hypothetical protein